MPFPMLSKTLKGKEVLILTHRGADVDAISACGMLYFALKDSANPHIGVPEHTNQAAEKLAQEMHLPITLNPECKEFNSVVVLDLNSWKMLGPTAGRLKEFLGEKFLDILVDEEITGVAGCVLMQVMRQKGNRIALCILAPFRSDRR